MQLETAAAVISHIAHLEKASAEFYEKLTACHPGFEDHLRVFAKESRKNEVRIRQAYYNSATDALETSFSFKGLTAEVEVPHPECGAAPPEDLESALRLENEIRMFYERAAESSKLLLSDVSRVMRRMAQIRQRRRDKILSFLKVH